MPGTWTTVEIAGKFADVYDPSAGVQPRFALLHLHGDNGETLRSRPAFTRLFDDLRLGCLCPYGRRSWWADRVCSEFDLTLTPERHLLDNVVPFFRSRWGLAPRALGLQGIGMGGQGALRLAFKYPQLFPAVAAIAPALDYYELYGQGTPLDEMYDSKEQCRQDTALLHIHPARQPPHLFFCVDPTDMQWFRGNDRLHEKLTALGVAHTVDFTTRAGGHTWAYFDHMAERVERYLHAALDTESRRLM